MFSDVSIFASGADVFVSDQDMLRSAVIGAPTGLGVSYVFVLNANISITGSIVIPANKNITLTSANGVSCGLVGVTNNAYTIVVNGALTLDGITVTHMSGTTGGCGVHVSRDGILTLLSGEISGNSDGGVRNDGTFEMYGGVITNNVASRGGGVFNEGHFRLFDGVISNNTADNGGGVNNFVSFSMYGGKITNNTSTSVGSGVYSVWPSSFSMSAGEITNNKAWAGGGVYNSGAVFSMSGGKISDNTVSSMGGGVYSTGEFNMHSGMISGNSATSGGGVYVGGDFIRSSVCHLMSGTISKNRATGNGGGVWVTDDCSYLERLFVSDGVVFSDNLASAAYNRASSFDAVYNSQIGRKVVWTSPFSQGYNNYDISYVYGVSLTQYTVTVYSSYATFTGAGNYSIGAYVTINAGTRDGYTFSGWSINAGNGGGVILPNVAVATFTMPANNLVITANWNYTSTNVPTDNPPPTTVVPLVPSIPISTPPNSPPPGVVNIFPTPSNKTSLSIWSFRDIIIVGCVVLIIAGILVVLLNKKPKTSM